MSEMSIPMMKRATSRAARACAVALLPAMLAPVSASAQAPPAERLKVLFLGDDGHHRPYVRAKEILPILAYNGIDLFYTDRASDLETENLNRYHALVFYNNQPAISPGQLAALMRFVENGGGLTVVHSASASFQNSEEFIRLVGAAFKSHGTGSFSAERVAPDHPAVRGIPTFTSPWEETYIHTKHNPVARTVLEVRRDGSHEEPWTWVRTHGAGRVFYTAWGHDQRTWGEEGFQRLLANGIKWSAGDWALERVATGPTPPNQRLEYGLPIYARPPAPWNTLEGMRDTAQVALSPEESNALMSLPPGFRVELFASEPMIRRLIDFTWDARGRMWAIETNDYPNDVVHDSIVGDVTRGPHTPHPGPYPGAKDRILILEDTNGDGRADDVKVFAEGLNLATTLVLANGGVIVGQAPHVLFFRDTDGDDVADVREVLFSGWPRGDTHGQISNLRWGFDNRIWGSVGYNGFRGTVGDMTYISPGPRAAASGGFTMGAGYFRFPRDLSTLDYVARTSNNTWGVAFSEDGYVFGSTANSRPSQFVHIPGRYYRSIGMQNPVLPGIADRLDVYPVREILQVDQFGRYTAGAAHEIYTARAFPREYWNRIAFVAEPTAHLVGMFELTQNGSGFRAKNRWSFMASRDEWAAPVQVKVGPDGAVWVSDFYTLVAQHNPQEPHLERGAGAAYVTPNRDAQRARVYRIVHEAAPAHPIRRLDNATPQELVAALRDDNMFWRMTAQQMLVERGQTDVVPQLIRLVQDHSVDGLGLNPGALHALWTLDGLGAIANSTQARDAARTALAHPAASVRRAALQILPRDGRLLDDIIGAGILPDRTSPHAVDYTVPSAILQDADGQVRITAVLALSELPPSPRAAAILAEMVAVPQNMRDQWIPEAIAIAGVKQGPQFLIDQVRAPRRGPADSAALAGMARAVNMMTRHYATQGRPQTATIVALIQAVPQLNPVVGAGVLTGIVSGNGGWPDEQPPQLTPQQRAALAGAARASAPELAEHYNRIAERWGTPDVFR